jgi:hypothetical protein
MSADIGDPALSFDSSSNPVTGQYLDSSALAPVVSQDEVNTNFGINQDQATADLGAELSGGSGGSGAAKSAGSAAASTGASGAVSAALKALGLNSSTASGLAGLASILGAVGQYKQNKAYAPTFSPPALFGGTPGTTSGNSAGSASTGFGPAGGYNYANYKGLTGNSAGLGFTPRSQINAKIPNYYTYGQDPQASFYTGTPATVTPATGATGGIGSIGTVQQGPQSYRKGGAVTTPQRFDVGGVPQMQLGTPPQGAPSLGNSLASQGVIQPLPQQPTAQPTSQGFLPQQQPQQPTALPAAPQLGMTPPGLPSTGMSGGVSPGMRPNNQTLPSPTPPAMPQRPMVGGPGMQMRPGMPNPAQRPMMQTPQRPMMQTPQRPMMRPMMRADGGTTITPNQEPQRLNMPQSGLTGSNGSPLSQVAKMRQVGANGPHPYAEGGALPAGIPESNVSRHVKGPGDGTSDSIPARLANGEYVMDAQTVSMLGNGDNGAGAKQLDAFREHIRKHKGAALAQGKMAPDAKQPHQYLPSTK